MKYTIEGFSQEYALTLKKTVPTKDNKEKVIKIDFTDLVILRWFVDFYPNMRKMTVDGKEYAWLSHKKMLMDLPLLDISKRACIERMQKLVEFEILDYQFVKDGGTFSLYTFGKNYINMISSERSTDSGVCGQPDTVGTQSNEQGECTQTDTGGSRSNVHGVCGQPDNKDNSIIDTSIIEDKSNNILTPEKEFEILWKMYPRKIGKDKALSYYIKARKNKKCPTTFEQVEQGIKNYCAEIKAKKIETQYIKHGSTWFNNKCWNDEYETSEAEQPQEPKRYGGTYL